MRSVCNLAFEATYQHRQQRRTSLLKRALVGLVLCCGVSVASAQPAFPLGINQE